MKTKRKTPDIRFRGFSDDWEQRKLEELADIVGGGTPSTSNNEYWNGDIEWYSPAELDGTVFVYNSERKITNLGLTKSSAKILPIGTVLFTSRAGIGKTAILGKESSTNQGFQSIVPKEELLNSYFIFSMTDILKRESEKLASGSTFLEISGKQMQKIKLLFPKDYLEQNKIGSFFEILDNDITLHQRKLQQLKEVKRGMLLKMFPRKNLLLPEIRFSEYTKKWEICSLDKIGKIETGNTPPTKDKGNYSDEGLLWITPTDIQSIITTKSEKMLTKKGADVARVVNGGSILFTCIASIGKNTMVLENAAFNQQINALTPNNITHSYFILAQSGFLSKKMNAMAASGTMKIINKTEFSKIKIYHTCLEEQEKIGFFFEKLDRMIELQEREIELLEQTKKGFLQKMFV